MAEPFEFKPGMYMPLSEIVIETERQRLVPITQEFAEDILREFTPEITRYMIPLPASSMEDVLAFIENSQKNMQAGYEVVFAATDKTSGEFLGNVGLHGRDKIHTPHLGLWFKKAVHGKGYGGEAIRGVIDWAVTHLNIEVFRYPVDRANIPSRKIPESLGGKIVEEFKGATMDPDKFLDEIVFEIPAVAAALG